MSTTLLLIILTGLISYRAFNDQQTFLRLKHYPYGEKRTKEYYRWLTAGFVHANWLHFGLNMYVLYLFGDIVEKFFVLSFGDFRGRTFYILIYLITIVLANMPTFYRHRDNPAFASIGASGAVSGILFIFVLLYPWSTLLLFFVIPMPAIVLAVLFLAYSSWASRHSNDRIDHMGHFYGAIFGVLLTIAVKPDIIQIFLYQIKQLPF